MNECQATIKKAEEALGPLTEGQRVDLLLDNHMWISDSDHAREIVHFIEKYGE